MKEIGLNVALLKGSDAGVGWRSNSIPSDGHIMTNKDEPGLIQIALSDGIPKRAFKTALVMGTILNLVNHGDVILAQDPLPWVKIICTYCLPYFVSSWGAVGAKRAQLRAAI